jgi:hypothetical protein
MDFGISEQKYPPADQFTPTPEVVDLWLTSQP